MTPPWRSRRPISSPGSAGASRASRAAAIAEQAVSHGRSAAGGQPRAASHLADRHHHLAARAAGLQARDRLGAAREREALGHGGADRSLDVPLYERGDVGRILLRKARGEVPPEDADDLAALEKRKIERELGDSRGEADNQVPASAADRAQRRLAVVAADGVVDHLRALLAAR